MNLWRRTEIHGTFLTTGGGQAAEQRHGTVGGHLAQLVASGTELGFAGVRAGDPRHVHAGILGRLWSRCRTLRLRYALYLMAASMFQAVMFAAGGSAMALAVDVESGLLGRMRAMPIHAMVTIGGRMLTDLLRSVASLCAVIMLGLLCGAQPANWMRLAGAFLVALVMGEALVLVFLGTCLRSRHPVQTAGLIQALEMPLLMLSTAFIPLSTLPDMAGTRSCSSAFFSDD